jgi:predicted nuclease of predicted toxin-antitoxin system
MKFKLDENLPVEIASYLEQQGHDAQTVPEEGLAGALDSTLLQRVKEERRVFLTMDKGIADVRSYPPEQYCGLVLFRPPASGRGTVSKFVRQHLPHLQEQQLKGHLFVISRSVIRKR